MALYLQVSGNFKLAEDSSLAELLSSYPLSLTESAEISESASPYMLLADSTTDEAVNFGSVTTAKAFLIISNRAISVKINGGDTGIPIGHTATEGGWLLLPATDVTSLSLTNASGDVAKVYIVLAGV